MSYLQAGESVLIQTEKLSVFRGALEVIHHASLSIPEGGVTAVSGPFGAGKSSLLLALARLDGQEEELRIEGGIRWKGIAQGPGEERQRIQRRRAGYIASEASPFNMTVRDNLIWARRQARSPMPEDECVRKSLEQVGLWFEIRDKLKRNALELSPGQQQRLCMARALAAGAEALLLDDPARNLDPISSGKLEEAVAAIADSLTVIFATANTRQAARVSERIIILMDGSVIETGNTREVYANPKDSRTETFISGRMQGAYA